MKAWEFLVTYNGVLAVIVAVVVSVIGFAHYISVRRSEERGKQYDRYHKLLDDLNANVRGDAPFIDRQIAVVFELRNFPEYYPVSLRILRRSLERWRVQNNLSKLTVPALGGSIHGLYDEARLTIQFIEKQLDLNRRFCIDPNDH